MQTKKENLESALGLSDVDELVANCIELSMTESRVSEILKKLICSDLGTKELVFSAFICGKLQGSNDTTMQDMIKDYAFYLLKKKINNNK